MRLRPHTAAPACGGRGSVEERSESTASSLVQLGGSKQTSRRGSGVLQTPTAGVIHAILTLIPAMLTLIIACSRGLVRG